MIYIIVTTIALCASALEAVTYHGFFLRHIHIPAEILYGISGISAVWASKLNKKLSIIIPIIGYGVALICVLAEAGEAATYPNFVFSHIHLNLISLQILAGLVWFHVGIATKKGVVQSLVIATLVFVAIAGIGTTAGNIGRGIGEIVRAPFESYSTKMARAYPGFYPAIEKVKEVTPSTATVLIPPQGNPWEMEGNAAMVEYFLYPRKVINFDPTQNPSNISGPVYALIAKGSWPRTGVVDYGWPKIPISAEKIWKIDVVTNRTYEFDRNYDPQGDMWDWGLIEVKHE